MEIRFLKNSEINFIRWDNCINNATNGNVFAFSWYLNIICDDWHALISGDYEYVMPLLIKTKHKQNLVYSSDIKALLGVFSKKLITKNIIDLFIQKIPNYFQKISYSVNKFNGQISNSLRTTTYDLDLIQPYTNIRRKYSDSFQAKLHVAADKNISSVKGLMPNDLIQSSQKGGFISTPSLSNNNLTRLRKIIAHGIRYNQAEVHGVYTKHNVLNAAVLFLKSKYKVYVLFSMINKQELNSYPIHYVIDKFIETHAEKNLTLNLDNLVLINDKDFYTGIGAQENYYNKIIQNKLRWYQRILIK